MAALKTNLKNRVVVAPKSVNLSTVMLWTDSMIALTGTSCRVKAFCANRVMDIQQKTTE